MFVRFINLFLKRPFGAKFIEKCYLLKNKNTVK